MKSTNILTTNLIKHDLAHVRKNCQVLHPTAALIKLSVYIDLFTLNAKNNLMQKTSGNVFLGCLGG